MNSNLQKQVEELDKQCEELLQDLLKEMNTSKNLEMESQRASVENKELTEYLDFLEETNVYCNCTSELANAGKEIQSVGKHQQRRKVQELKSRSERALWFLQSFG